MPITRFPFSSGCCRYRMAVFRLLRRCCDSIRRGIKSATILAFKSWRRKRNREREGIVGQLKRSQAAAARRGDNFQKQRCYFSSSLVNSAEREREELVIKRPLIWCAGYGIAGIYLLLPAITSAQETAP